MNVAVAARSRFGMRTSLAFWPALLLLCGLAALLVARVVGVNVHGVGHSGVSLCWFQSLTSLSCPGCGMTRAMIALVEGDVSAAWAFHPAAPPLVGGAVFVVTAPASWVARLEESARRAPRVWGAVGWLAVVVVVGRWVAGL